MYAALGGRRVFEAAVEDFYRRVVGDEALRRYFEGIELGRLKAHQQSFLAMALGGPRAYVGRTMASAHGTLAITDEAFDRVLDHLVGTLADLGVASELIHGTVSALLALRHDVVRVPGTEHDREAGLAAWRRSGDGPRVQAGPLPDWERRQPARRIEPADPVEPIGRVDPVERDGAWRAVASAPAPAFQPHPDNPAHERHQRHRPHQRDEHNERQDGYEHHERWDRRER
jgi:hemoglobin